jgi:hypothetical protein
MSRFIIVALIAVAAFAPCGMSASTDVTVTINARETENYQWAMFRLWIPEEVKTIRGVLVLVPGAGVDGRALADNPGWQAFAREEQFALVSCYIKGRIGRVAYLAKNGTGDALIQGLSHLAARGRRPEVKDAPLLIWGHVVGGQFAHAMACYAPERIIAFAAVKSQQFRAIPKPKTFQVPAVLVAGSKDSLKRIQGQYNLLYRNRPKGALWCLAIEKGGYDEPGNSGPILVAPFFKSILKKRMPKGEGAVSYKSLAALSEKDGHLGHIPTGKTTTYNDFSESRARAVWLPDAATAQQWRTFMKGGYEPPRRGGVIRKR